MITATYDLKSGWSFHGQPDDVFAVRFSNGGAERIYPNGLAFGWDSSTGESSEWPGRNAVVREISTNRTFEYRLSAMPDDVVTLSLWAENDGHRVFGETTFTIPRPPQPYPSWTWDNGWNPPVAYPKDGKRYNWDEATTSWVEVTDVDN